MDTLLKKLELAEQQTQELIERQISTKMKFSSELILKDKTMSRMKRELNMY